MEKENLIIKKSKRPLATYKNQKIFWGIVFLTPWLLGIIFLFGFPLLQSLYYSFYELIPKPGQLLTEFVGFENYIFAFNEHVTPVSSFKVELLNTVTDVVINLPVLLIFSLFIAVMLNAEFKGRAAIRAIFFIPVILNSTAIATALGGGDVLTQILESQNIGKLFDLQYFLVQTGLHEAFVGFIVGLIDRIYDILALAGVPILLFLASIQSVPKHLYEAAKIEGATSYEMFWLITLPNVSSHIITVTVYALVDTFLTSSVSEIISTELNKQQWGVASAMSWVYVLSIISILIVIFSLAKVFKIGGSHYED